jgi:hypothetical protein
MRRLREQPCISTTAATASPAGRYYRRRASGFAVDAHWHPTISGAVTTAGVISIASNIARAIIDPAASSARQRCQPIRADHHERPDPRLQIHRPTDMIEGDNRQQPENE